jgi:hypothetical protein
MKRHPVRHERGCAPEAGAPEREAWKIIFGAFAVSGSLVIAWTLFVLLTDSPPATRMGDQATQTTGTQPQPKP